MARDGIGGIAGGEGRDLVGRVEALCRSEKKGERKRRVDFALFRENHGIEGDAHAGPWHRQVSLLALEDIDAFSRNSQCKYAAGDFAENVIVSNLDLSRLGLGTRLRLGTEVVLSVTQIGKVCHAPCRIRELTGDCVMPRAGVFARVVTGGEVRIGDSVEVVDLVERVRVAAVVLTVSDRCAAGIAKDTAGPAVAARLEASLHAHVYRVEIVPDEHPIIVDRLKHYCDGHSIDLVACVGGTGFGPRDVTPEATRAVIERFAPGLDEGMRAASMAKTPHAALSRGVSGIRGSTLILCLPGSETAAVENLDAVLPALRHGLDKLRGDRADCGRRSVTDKARAD